MASLATAVRLSSRLTGRQLRRDAARRGFRSATALAAAQNFTMPALSPTMTEGSISSWKVKAGDSFVAGDVLLEIETDKATMDVEAQEDGVLVQIMQGDGAKAVQVGSRIAVIAEAGDDVSKLEIPPDEAPKSAVSSSSSQPPKEEAKPTETKQAAPAEASTTTRRPSGPQKYPLLPSVQHLLHEHGIPESAVAEMSATGPQGRLLKGDVLAYIGSIPKDRPEQVAQGIEKLSHLDLSNIKLKAPPPAPEKKPDTTTAAAAAPPSPEVLLKHVTLPVSLAPALDVQKKLQGSLGVFLPLATFVARAADVANDDLPPAPGGVPSADDLFDDVLGLPHIARGRADSRGYYLPDIVALGHAAGPAAPMKAARKDVDIIDFLAGTSWPAARAKTTTGLPGISAGVNLFSLTVPEGEERRAKVFLERVKVVLEKEPGRLVL